MIVVKMTRRRKMSDSERSGMEEEEDEVEESKEERGTGRETGRERRVREEGRERGMVGKAEDREGLFTGVGRGVVRE